MGVDVVLGVPQGYWDKLKHPPENFVVWLNSFDPATEFFETTTVEPDQWCVERPWFHVSKGVGGKKSFTDRMDDGMLRRIDAATGGKPVFAVSGIPGTVGSGTRLFWKKLRHLLTGGNFAVWPFHGDLNTLLGKHDVVLCETYPALAYAAALARELPTLRIAGHKTNPVWREGVCCRVAQADWVRANQVDLGDLSKPKANDDDFDAWVVAAAVLRCLLEKPDLLENLDSFNRPATTDPNLISKTAEGSMLLAGAIDFDRKNRRNAR